MKCIGGRVGRWLRKAGTATVAALALFGATMGAMAQNIFNSDGYGHGAPVAANPLPDIVTLTGYGTNGDKPWPSGVSGASSSKFNGGVYDGNGHVWLIPINANRVVKVSTADGTMTGYSGWANAGLTGAETTKFRSGAYDGNGNIWMIPANVDRVVKVSTADGTMTGYNGWPNGVTLGSSSFWGSVYDGNGHVWMIPYTASHIVKINTANGNMSRVEWPAGNTNPQFAFSGGVYDGTHIWMIPYNATATGAKVMKINVATGAMEELEWPTGFVRRSAAYFGGVYDGNGNVWMIPYTANFVMKIDTATGAMTECTGWPWSAPGFDLQSGGRFSGGAFDGRYIWMAPVNCTRIVRVDTAAGINQGKMEAYDWSGLTSFTKGPLAFMSGAFDGENVWLIPSNADRVVKLGGVRTPTFVPVTRIDGLPSAMTAGTPLTLSGTVEPQNATYQAISWSVNAANGTGANVSGNTMTATTAGTASITATIAKGLADGTPGTPYTTNFNVAVSAPSSGDIPVTAIHGIPTVVYIGTPLTLTGTVEPDNATYKTITWDIFNNNGTGAAISNGNIVNATEAGTFVLFATVAYGNPINGAWSYSTNLTVTVLVPTQSTPPSFTPGSDLKVGDENVGVVDPGTDTTIEDGTPVLVIIGTHPPLEGFLEDDGEGNLVVVIPGGIPDGYEGPNQDIKVIPNPDPNGKGDELLGGKVNIDKDPSFTPESPIYTGETDIGGIDFGTSETVTNGAPVEVTFDDGKGNKQTRTGRIENGRVVLDDPIDDTFIGDWDITVTVNPGDPEGETVVPSVKGKVGKRPSFTANSLIYTGETDIGGIDFGTSETVTNGAPVEVVFDDGKGKTVTRPGRIENGRVVLDDPIDDTFIGDWDITVTVNPGDPEGETVVPTVKGKVGKRPSFTPDAPIYVGETDIGGIDFGTSETVTNGAPVLVTFDDGKGNPRTRTGRIENGRVVLDDPIEDDLIGDWYITVTVNPGDPEGETVVPSVKGRVGKRPSFTANSLIYTGETDIGAIDPGTNSTVTNDAPVAVTIGGKPFTGRIFNGRVILDDPVSDDLIGDNVVITVIVNPNTGESVPLGDTATILYGGEGEQWIMVGAIVAPPASGGDVFLSWDWAQVRLPGTVRYIVYTSETLDKPLTAWDAVNEAEDVSQEAILVTRNITKGAAVWHEARMIGHGDTAARFFRVKAVRVGN